MKKIRIIKDIPGYCSGSKIETDHSIIATPRDTNHMYDISELVDDGYAEYLADEPDAPQLPSKIEEGSYGVNIAMHALISKVNALIDVVAYLLAKEK